MEVLTYRYIFIQAPGIAQAISQCPWCIAEGEGRRIAERVHIEIGSGSRTALAIAAIDASLISYAVIGIAAASERYVADALIVPSGVPEV